jgi:uncharacterized protein (DUF885 family)
MLDDNLGRALRLLSDVWDTLRQSPATQQQMDGVMSRLPDLSLNGAQARSTAAKELLDRMQGLDEEALPHGVQVALRQARYRLSNVAVEARWYWMVIDPLGIGFFGMFAPSAYCGGHLLNAVFRSLQAATFTHAGDSDRYLGLVADLAGMVDQMTERTLGQSERGMRIPKPQLPAARGIVTALMNQSRRVIPVQVARLSQDESSTTFSREVQRRIDDLVVPAFERFAAVLSPEYEQRAPDEVGLGQYPGGAEIYAELVKRHTTTDLTPAQVHDIGMRRMAQIEDEMRELRATAGLADDPAAYLARAHADPRFSATSTEGVASVFRRYIDRLEPVLDQAFHSRPGAQYGVAALPEALEASMTFGYYDLPRNGDAVGRYMFNARNLRRQQLMNIASLTYHELVPGHHLHLASQNENQALLPVSRYSFVNAYNEGWAEYAATLAGELGMYAEPEERYGRLIMDAFLTSRLVADTGMNAFGWSLEKARDYMREFSSMSEDEVRSESLRYSCDLPAQALAYKLGDTEMLRLRENMRSRLNDRFDLRDFHAAVLSAGALPMQDLAWHLDATIDRLSNTANQGQ